MRPMRRKWLFFVLLPIAAAVLGATLYKWVDERGVTHYSETPPATKKAQEIRIQPAPPSGPGKDGVKPAQASPAPAAEGTKATSKSWQEKAAEAQKRREETEKRDEEERALAKEIAQERQKRCLAAQQNLEALRTRRPVYHVDERGEHVFIDDAQRAAAIARAKREIQSYCDPEAR